MGIANSHELTVRPLRVDRRQFTHVAQFSGAQRGPANVLRTHRRGPERRQPQCQPKSREVFMDSRLDPRRHR